MASAAWRRFIVFISLRALLLTVRCRMRERSEYFSPDAPTPAIFCIWHNRLATCIKILDVHRRPHNAGAGMAALVSASRDGALLARILEWFRVQPVRGSSQPARRAGVARIDDLGGTRLRPDHHAGRPARAALRDSGRHHVARAS